MLTDAERRTLTEIESGLRRDDPGFVQQFDDIARHPRRSDRKDGIVRAWLVIGILALAVAGMVQSALIVVIGLSALSAAGAWWLAPADTPDLLTAEDEGTG